MWNTLSLKIENGIATITIDRKEQLNALNREVLQELYAAAKQIAEGSGINAVVVTGAGDKAFVAGADIGTMSTLGPNEAQEFAELGHKAFSALENLEQPVIAAINGFALGGGCELAIACDMRIASDTAKFGQPEVGLAILAGFGGTQRLPRLIGPGRAKYMLFTGEMISAATAMEFGLVDMVVPAAELQEKVYKIAAKICRQDPFAVRQTKRCIVKGLDASYATGLDYEIQAYGYCYTRAEQKEAMRAFLNKGK